MRTGRKQSRTNRIVAATVDGLNQRELASLEGWLIESYLRDLTHRLQAPIEFVARVRADVLTAVDERPARVPPWHRVPVWTWLTDIRLQRRSLNAR